MFNLPIKFFPRDKITGSMEKVGDEFTAFFLVGATKFRVIEKHNGFVMAEFVGGVK